MELESDLIYQLCYLILFWLAQLLIKKNAFLSTVLNTSFSLKAKHQFCLKIYSSSHVSRFTNSQKTLIYVFLWSKQTNKVMK